MAGMFLSSSAFSHGICRYRSDCNGLGWTRKAEAHVFNFGFPLSRIRTSCGYNSLADAIRSNSCAYQRTRNSFAGCQQSGYVSKRICARGNAYSSLFQKLNFDNFSSVEDFEQSETVSKKVHFNRNSVAIDSVNGFMETKGKSMFSSYEVRVWIPTSETDTLETSEKTIVFGKLVLMNGELIKEGFFKEYDFRVSTNRDGVSRVDLNNIMLHFDLPEGITSDMVEVMTLSDGGADESDAFDSKIKENEINIPTPPIVGVFLVCELRSTGSAIKFFWCDK